MFINPIHSLDKTRFGINFKTEDIKCKLNKNKEVIVNIKDKKVK